MSEVTDPDPKLNSAQSFAEKIDTRNELAWNLGHKEFERAGELSQNALELSTTGEFSEQAYLQGQATSLTTLAFLNHQIGKLDAALSQCFHAASLLESLPQRCH